MSDHLMTLEVVDQDGAIREAADAVADDTRADFFRRAGVAGGSLLAGGVLMGGLPALASAKPSKRQDVRILNYALTLEYLEAEFYVQARDRGALTDPVVARFARVVADHETAHVRFLRSALGRAAVRKPTFDFGDTVTDQEKFKQTAQVLEDTGVAAYAGQGTRIKQAAVVKAALSIHSVEARHAAWIRFINGGGAANAATSALPAPVDFDRPKSMAAILRAVRGTGFIKS